MTDNSWDLAEESFLVARGDPEAAAAIAKAIDEHNPEAIIPLSWLHKDCAVSYMRVHIKVPLAAASSYGTTAGSNADPEHWEDIISMFLLAGATSVTTGANQHAITRALMMEDSVVGRRQIATYSVNKISKKVVRLTLSSYAYTRLKLSE